MPPWYPSQPYLSIPILTAVLKSQGYIVKQKDLNLEFYDYLLKKKNIEEIFSQKALFLNTDSLSQLFLIKDTLIDEIDNAKQVLKCDDLFIKSKYEYAIKIIELSLKTYTALDNQISIFLDTINYNFNKYDIAQISLYIKSSNIFTRFFHSYFKNSLFDYSFVGISVTTSEQLIPSLTLAKFIREKSPETKILLGGDLITRLKDEICSNQKLTEYFDFCIYGYGEKAILKFAELIDGKIEVEDVPNLIYKSKNLIKINLEGKLDNFSSIPPPDFDDLPLSKYLTPTVILPFEISKGCYWGKCTFCEITGLPLYIKNYKKVIEELIFLKEKYNVNIFTITDSAAPPSIIHKMAKYFKKNRTNIHWSALVRTEEYFDYKTTKDLYEGGCGMVFIGFESGSQNIVDAMEKGTEIGISQKVLHNFHSSNIWVHGYFMFGFPGETTEDVKSTLAFMQKNINDFNSIGMSTFILALNTPIDKHREKYNITIDLDDVSELQIHRNIIINNNNENYIKSNYLEMKNMLANYELYHLNELLLFKVKEL